MKKAITLFVLGVFLASTAFGAVAVKEDGAYVGEAVSIDLRQLPQSAAVTKSGSDVRVDFNYGASGIVEVTAADTPITLTTAQGGSTVLLTDALAVGGRVVTLPDVTASNDGLWFKIGGSLVDGTWTAPDSYVVIVRPYDSGNTIRYKSLFTAGANATKGRGIQATVNSADSYPTIRLMVHDGNWLVTDAKGDWAQEDQDL